VKRAPPSRREKAMGKLFWRAYEASVNAAAVALFSVMVAVTAMGVFSRYVLNDALPWAEEADRYVFIWLSFVGASITMRHNAHIAVDILVRTFKPAHRRWAALLSGACILVFLAVVYRASEPVIAVTSLSRTTATDVPMSWVYLAVPVGCILVGIETLRLMARTWQNLGKEARE
jgi:TRAP-type C4-dicarboxylate transport system permease small subunit